MRHSRASLDEIYPQLRIESGRSYILYLIRGFMESRAKFLGHPVHPMLIVFPLGLLATAVIFDIIALTKNVPSLFNAAYWMIVAGVIGGLISAIFGLIDWLAIPIGTRARAIGLWHGVGNLVVMVLFATSWWLRRPTPDHPSGAALGFSSLP